MYDLCRGFYSRTSYHYIDEEGFCILQRLIFSCISYTFPVAAFMTRIISLPNTACPVSDR